MENMAQEQKDRIFAEKQKRIAQELRAIYTPNNAPPAEAKTVNDEIDRALEMLKRNIHAIRVE